MTLLQDNYAATTRSTLSVAYTPDSDDAFNFYAWEHGQVALDGYDAEFAREHIIALEPLDKGLMGTLLRYPYEVRSADEYFDDIQDVKVTKDMLDLAKHIVNQKAGHFEPDKFEDQYETAPSN